MYALMYALWSTVFNFATLLLFYLVLTTFHFRVSYVTCINLVGLNVFYSVVEINIELL